MKPSSARFRSALVSATLVSLAGGAILRAAQIQSVPPPRVPPRPLPLPVHPLVGVQVSSVDVRATVREGVATTEVSYLFANRSESAQEGDFVFPIPAGATVREFAMYDGEKKLDAQLLNEKEAIATYEEIVRRRRDPALLTFAGQSALRVRVFPIAAHAERRLTLKLAVVLPREGGARRFAWTLVGPHLALGAPNAQPERVSVHVTAFGTGNIYSPTHDVSVRRDDDGKSVASWSSDKGASSLAENPEFALYLSPKDPRAIALSCLSYNAALPQVASIGGGMRQSGYFLVVASPNLPDSAKVIPARRVVLVMDRSGSMAGKKIEQARGALKVALGKLRPQDRFNILTFSDRVESFAPQLLAASPDNLKRAHAFVDDMSADGGTNIHEALQKGLAQFPEQSRSNSLLFFTDGLPTVGTRDQSAIVRDAKKACGRKARAFVFGVGYDVDVPFLDTVASTLRGDADYVRPDEDIEVKTSLFVAKTSTPVLENLKLVVDGGRVGEIYPRAEDMPDLFDGGQLVLVGRYTGEGKASLTLTGEVAGKPQSYTLETTFPAVATEADFLPRLWASRKIGYLMDEIRLAEGDDPRKKEIVEQIVALSKEFGILTPYTALFVPEPGTEDRAVALREAGRGAGAARPGITGGGAMIGGMPAARAGESAVNASQANRAMKAQAQVGNVYALRATRGLELKENEQRVRRVQNAASRTFYQNGALWQDATFDEKKQTEIVKVKLYSDAYFALTRRNANFAKWASLGNQVLIAANAKQAVQFGDEGRESLTEKEIDALAGR